MRRRGHLGDGRIGARGPLGAVLAFVLAFALAPMQPALAAAAAPAPYCSARSALAAGTPLLSAQRARTAALGFLADVRTPGAFSDWAAGTVDTGTRTDDLDGHASAYVFRVTGASGAYLGYLTIDAVPRVNPVIEFSRAAAPVFARIVDAESALAAGGRNAQVERQLYLGPHLYALETASTATAASEYVDIAEVQRDASQDPIRGPPAPLGTISTAAIGTRYRLIAGVPDYHQFGYNYRSTEYNASTLPATTGKYLEDPYLDSGAYFSGCAPTSAGNIVKYWAGHGYPALDRNLLPKYASPYDPNAADDYSPPKAPYQKMINDLHVFFHTFHSEGDGGAAWPYDFAPGLTSYAKKIGGYTFTATPINNFSWVDYAAEIAADRPVLLGFNGLEVYAPDDFEYGDHAITGVGYDYTPTVRGSEYLIIRDNWDNEPADVYLQFAGRNAVYTYRFMVAFAPAVPPANDSFSSATVLPGASSGSVIGVSTSATNESGEPPHAGNSGGASVWFKWTPSSSGWVGFSTGGSSFDTLLNVYTGTSVSALTSITSSDDFGKSRTSAAGFYAVSGTTYRIAIDGFRENDGSVAKGAYELKWYPLHSLSGYVRTAGGSGVSGVKVTCSDGKTAFTNGSGAYTIAGLFDGTYSLTVSKAGAGFTPESCSKTLSGSNGTAPDFVGQPNDAFASALPLVSYASASGSNSSGTKESGEKWHAGNAGGASVWFSWTAPESRRVWVSAVGSSFDTLLGVYTGTAVSSLTTVAYSDDYSGLNTSALSFNAVGGTTYRIAVDGYKSGTTAATGRYRLAWNAVGAASLTKPALSVSSPLHGSYFTITGYVTPWCRGTVSVKLYRKVSGSYKLQSSSNRTLSTSGSRAKYTYKVKVPSKGSWAVRTYYAGGVFSTKAWSVYRYFTAR